MKNYLSIFCLLILSQIVQSQNPTPNAGFENWNTVVPVSGNPYDSLHGWQTLNYKTNILGIYTCQKASGVDAHTGQFAAKFVTKQPFGIIANGIASTAELITVAPYGVTGGIPFTQRPDSISGWFKNTPQNGDTAFIELVLFDSISGNRVGWATYDITGAHASYQRFSAPVTYYNGNNPNMCYWILSSSGRVNKYLNSTLFVDDIAMVYNGVGINEIKENDAVVFFDSQNQLLHVKSDMPDIEIMVSDITGKMLLCQKISGSDVVNLNGHKAGTYIYQLTSKNGSLIKRNSFIIQ